jgi:hypothetical protein
MILSKPKPISLAGNPVELKVQLNPMSEPGQFCRYQLIFDADESVADGDYFTLNWGSNSVTITFRDDPNAAANEYVSGPCTNTWNEGLADFLSTIYLFNQDFIISWGIIFIRITSREKGNAYNFTVQTNISINVFDYFQIRIGTDPKMLENPQIICIVKHTTSGVIIGKENITPPEDGIVTFDVSEYLNTFIANMRQNFTGYHYPATITKIWKHSTFVLPFKLEYLLTTGTSTNQIIKVSDNFYAVMGGFSKDKLLVAGHNFYDDIILQKGWLTYPTWKRINRNSPERLYYYSRYNETINVKAKLYHTENATSTVTVATIAATANSIYEIDACLSHLIAPHNDLIQYELWVENDDEVLRTYEFQFLIDRKYYDSEQYFLFLNSYGVFDTVRFTGRLTRTPDIDRSEFQDSTDKQTSLKNMMSVNFRINSGSISESEMGWLNELIISKEVYWIVMERPTPVISTGNKMTPFAGYNRRHQLTYDFKLAYQEEYHTNEKYSTGFVNPPPHG